MSPEGIILDNLNYLPAIIFDCNSHNYRGRGDRFRSDLDLIKNQLEATPIVKYPCEMLMMDGKTP